MGCGCAACPTYGNKSRGKIALVWQYGIYRESCTRVCESSAVSVRCVNFDTFVMGSTTSFIANRRIAQIHVLNKMRLGINFLRTTGASFSILKSTQYSMLNVEHFFKGEMLNT